MFFRHHIKDVRRQRSAPRKDQLQQELDEPNVFLYEIGLKMRQIASKLQKIYTEKINRNNSISKLKMQNSITEDYSHFKIN